MSEIATRHVVNDIRARLSNTNGELGDDDEWDVAYNASDQTDTSFVLYVAGRTWEGDTTLQSYTVTLTPRPEEK